MILRELGTIIAVTALITAIVIGLGSKFVTKKDDGPIEEAAEEFIEDEIEVGLGLPVHTMKDKIDLTPFSKEAK